ncbi:MAG TPA: hypothetical protein VL359_11790 [bacterium]|nr:hypothetical protein [bacterium]
MTSVRVVRRSIQTADGQRCADLFTRPDASFGFEEYRRDAEDPRGWFALGPHAAGAYGSEQATLEAARACIPWLAERLG